jgi:predicted ATPase
MRRWVRPLLSARLLGGFELRWRDQPIRALGSGRLRSLLAYFLLHPGTSHRRAALASLLWPDSDEAQARTNLRKRLLELRRAIPFFADLLHEEGDVLVWAEHPGVWVDAVEFGRLAKTARTASDLEQAVELYRGELLPGCLDEWVLRERERLQQTYLGLLERLVHARQSEGAVPAALYYARLLVREDPLQESSYRLLMRLYASAGDRAAALRVYRLCAEVLRRELGVDPSSATTVLCERIRRGEDVVPNNLPQPISRFVGRRRELGEIRRALEHARLVTLVGAGGCGKTRLALQVASEARLESPDGVWWADLALVADDGLIPSLVATAMGLREQPPRPLLQLIADFLKDRQALLVLDNCEHLLEGCAGLAVALLRGARSLRILATSREPLRAEGEWVYRVPPMETPPADAVAGWDQLLGCESVQLFVERARASGYMTLQPGDAGVVAEICRRLDGLPLAIELAAARACGMPLREIARQLLDHRFALLGDGARTALSRHRTLQAALDWSYEMLGSAERALLHRLSVFSGSWTLEAAEGICAGREVERAEVASGVTRLVSRSFVEWERPAQARYRLLETVREYARLKLIESGEAEELGRRHRDWYLALAERAGPHLTGPEQDAWFRRLEENLPNLRAALRWSLEHGDPEAELRLASALGQFWARCGRLSEGRTWLAEGLGCGGIPLPLRVRALVTSGQLAHHAADYEAAAALLWEGLVLARRCGDEEGEVEALVFLGLGATRQGSYNAARTYLLEGLRRAEQSGNLRGRALSHTGLGALAASCGNWVEASWEYQVASEVLQALGDKWNLAAVLHNLAHARSIAGEHEAARSLFEECLQMFRDAADRARVAQVAANLAAVLVHLGRSADARRALGESFAHLGEFENRLAAVCVLEGCALLAACLDHEEATAFFAAAARAREVLGMPLSDGERRHYEYDRYLGLVRSGLAQDRFQAAWTRGQGMTLREAMEAARAWLVAWSGPVDRGRSARTARRRA